MYLFGKTKTGELFINISLLAVSHIVINNPVMKDCKEMRQKYFDTLKRYVAISGHRNNQFEASMLDAYEKILLHSKRTRKKNQFDHYARYILLDLLFILDTKNGRAHFSDTRKLIDNYLADFKDSARRSSRAGGGVRLFWCVKNSYVRYINSVLDVRPGNANDLDILEKNNDFSNEKKYIGLIKKNYLFVKKEPYNIMVTATMSAGKSTFINAITGKYICLAQNMACTGKIHSIINKAYEDGYSYEFDHDLVLTAGREELMNDNEMNETDRIYVSTAFSGKLSKRRVVIDDSPGVNFSGNDIHKKITNDLIGEKKYDLLIYLMNATQLETNDDAEHLEYVKKTAGDKPIMFVVNKIDSFDPDNEDVISVVENLREHLIKKGFENPIVCPVSSKAGFLAKKFESSGLTRSEERELYTLIDKFNEIDLERYYKKYLPNIRINDKSQEEKQLSKTCGLDYVETIIKKKIDRRV